MSKRWRPWLAATALIALTACGSGSGGGGGTPDNTRGTVSGNLGPAAAGATVRLEGSDHVVTCGPDGSFTVPNVEPGEYTISVEGGGGQGGAAMIRVLPGENTPLPPLDLEATGQITGLITSRTESGLRPVAGARILARPIPLLYTYEDETRPGIADGVANSGGGRSRQDDNADERPPVRVAESEADGSFRFGAVTPGMYTIEVTAESYETGYNGTWVEPGRTSPVDLELVYIDPNNATVSGQVTVVEDGQTVPLSMVRVALWPRDGGPLPLAGARSRQNGGGGAGGEGGGNGGPNEYDGVVYPDGTVGNAPPGGPDVIGPNDDCWYVPPIWYCREGFTDEQGNFSLQNVPPGEYTLTYMRWGYATISRDVTLTTRQTLTANATLQYILTTVSGTVFGTPEGGGAAVPLANAWVTAWGYVVEPPVYEGGGPGGAGGGGGSVGGGNVAGLDASPYRPTGEVPPGVAVTDANGHFSLEVEAGYLNINAWADGYEYGSVDVTVAAGGLTGVELTLQPWTPSDQPRPEPVGVLRRR
ncbi:MAG: carboxypeptidase regulatory-like domain-containing protein [Fimbriimonadaceae bacterium]|nr:carboxypeptidase regulatory-like domain-containing protein [Fimbriimonadaceae bacterium]